MSGDVTENKPHKFSDFADKNEDIYQKGPKIKIEDVLGKEITILNFETKTSKYLDNNNSPKTYTFLEIEYNGENRVIMTGAKFLSNQLERYKQEIPFTCTIYKTSKNSYALK